MSVVFLWACIYLRTVYKPPLCWCMLRTAETINCYRILLIHELIYAVNANISAFSNCLWWVKFQLPVVSRKISSLSSNPVDEQ